MAPEPTRVTTVLGSCVSVTMFYRPLAIGAICHTSMPSGPMEDHRYVDAAVVAMSKWFTGRNVKLSTVETKIFGGASVLANGEGNTMAIEVGRNNIDRAIEIVDEMGLNLVRGVVGGYGGCKIVFFTHVGDVYLKRNAGLGAATGNQYLASGNRPGLFGAQK